MINSIAKELFYSLTGALINFVLMEIFWPGLVLAYINLNWVLIFWLIFGIVVIDINTLKHQNKSVKV